MKKIKILSGILLLIVAFTFAGCGSSSSQKTSGSDLKAIKDRGTLKVGVKLDVPKFGYKDPKTSKIKGFEIDLSKAVAKKIFGDENKVQFQGVTAKTRGPLLDSGQVDMIAATFTITDERKKSYNFSEPYFTDSVGLMVKKSSGIKDLKGLNEKKIGVAQSATSKQAIQKEAEKVGSKVTFMEFQGYPDIKSALDSGRIDCFSVDRSILTGYIDNSTVVLKEKFSPQDYGVATKKGNDELAKAVNETISEMKKSGELDKLIAKWGIQ
ncbi:transporter substrate-binding domain-containing protein [Clostridium tyrobutyricum]|jgi:putative glutamine transport system substrate-binding protein|uniref:transporter substrate-binding domain-containing protein n=1 Tax=Clostridium tyrobutyricum TaxID=1519 RepID=UPI00189D925D|nr:transporter substrate-binding domain-containing protein [Clostridium tyrobutyricum]MBR9647058.1 transporter substrate-binding domain-containing protein [Clostridium tyrobutyricum]